MERFEVQYPIGSREKEIKQILGFVTHGQSCQLISIPGAGRSTVLRLLAYHDKLREYQFKKLNPPNQESPARNATRSVAGGGIRNQGNRNQQIHNSLFIIPNSYLFVYVNFAEIPGFEPAELYKTLFLAMLSAMREFGPRTQPWTNIGKEIYSLFKEALGFNDPIVLFQFLKKAIQQYSNITIVFLFDRFSEFAGKTTGEFFSQLRSLRIASGGNLAIVFSTHRPLEDLLPASHWGDFYEFFAGNHVWLDLYDPTATDFRIGVLEKEYGKKLSPSVKEHLVKLTGGHGKLMKLSTQILLSAPRLNLITRFDLLDFLLSHTLIKGSLLEIWESLTREERELQLPFPLIVEFIKRNLAETLVPKTIRLDEKTNEIFFGDDQISGLTAQEFRLVAFLLKNPQRLCSRDEIINAVWTDTKTSEGVSDEALDQMIYRLRKKIEDEADNPKHLLTVKGRGFRFLP